MGKKISLGAAVTCILIAVALTFSITIVFSTNQYNTKIFELFKRESLQEKMVELDRIVRYNFFQDISEKSLIDGIAQGYILGIQDKYAVYRSSDDYKLYQEQLEGRSTGIGVKAAQDKAGYLYIYGIVAGSGADTAGLAVGDTIVKIEGQDVAVMGYDAATKAILGISGDNVALTIHRGGEEIALSVARQAYTISSIDYEILDNQIGYIRIEQFNDNTDELFTLALNNLVSSSVTGLIIDVRHNGGGQLEAAAHILDRLLPEGDIVSATYKGDRTEVLYTSDAEDVNLPMAVLVDGQTASAAELFAAAVKDYKKADLIGVQTFGKGTMQETFPLNDGSAITLSVAKFNPPKSANFEGVGVQPDYEVKNNYTTEFDFYTLTRDTDSQLKKAIEIITSQTKTPVPTDDTVIDPFSPG